MKVFKLLLKSNKQENNWNYEDKDEVKSGVVAFPFKGEEHELKKGAEIYYQYGQNIKIKGEEYILVNESNIICQEQ